MRYSQKPSEIIEQLRQAAALERSEASGSEILRVLTSHLRENDPPSDAFSEDYPIGGLIEPRDIEVEINLID